MLCPGPDSKAYMKFDMMLEDFLFSYVDKPHTSAPGATFINVIQL